MEARTKSEVLRQRQNAVMGGCCDRFANNSGCDCLVLALPDRPDATQPTVDITPNEMNELQDILRTLTPSGRAFVTNDRELVRLYEQAKEDVKSLQAFKAYVHKRLDEMGVPEDVAGAHLNAGCRIGGRLDWIKERLNPLTIDLPKQGDPYPPARPGATMVQERVDVIAPQTEVRLLGTHPDTTITGLVLQVSVGAAMEVQYQVGYWNGAAYVQTWFNACQVQQVVPSRKIRIGFTGTK